MLKEFDVIVTRNTVKKTKPYPEPYLKAAASLGLDTGDCVVIENAPMGILSAKKAGMEVLAITTTLTKDHLQKADFIADSFGEIEDYLEKNVLSL